MVCPFACSAWNRFEGAILVAVSTSTFTGLRACAGAVALACLAFAAPAMADIPTVPGGTIYAGSSGQISVPVTATVGGSCGFASGAAPSGNQNVGQLDTTTWTYDFPFTLQCTGPSRIAVTSSNGGLKTTPTVTAPGYLDTAPYDVAVHVVRTGGSTDGNCAAASLLSSSLAACALRGTASPTVGMAVTTPSYNLAGSYLRVTKSAYSGVLVSGTYTDTLVVTVSPAS
jgi:hypothetical protein